MEQDKTQTNFNEGLIQVKIVFWGPASSGKTTNLRAIAKLFPQNITGQPYEVSTSEERTIWEDYLAFQLEFPPYSFIFHIHTTTGQKRFLATREQVAKNADVILFIADSQEHRLKDNIRSYEELIAFTENKIPIVVEANKQDLPNSVTPEKLRQDLGLPSSIPIYGASAVKCKGVYKVFRDMIRLAIRNQTR